MTPRIAMLAWCGAAAAGSVAALLPSGGWAQPAQDTGAPVLRIVSPAPGALLSGSITLEAAIGPVERAGVVERVTFSVDGHEVCVITAPPFACEWDAGRDVVARVVRVVAQIAGGSRLARTVHTRALGYVDRVNVDAVQITVVVTDRDGRFVQRLPRDAFRVTEDGVSQVVTTFAADDIPLEVVAALDVSQSMADAMPALKHAARAFLDSLREHERVTLLAFNDNIFTLARRTTAGEARRRAVDRLAPWGGTALYDAILRGIALLSRQSGRRALVLFSDGEDQSSRASEEAALRGVEASDATVYTIGLGRGARVPALRQLLERLATLSGGRGLFTENSSALKSAFTEIVQDLSHQYLVGYQPTNQKRDGEWRRLRVEVSGGAYTVRHRQGYRLLPEARSGSEGP
jgi:Ca-activated chloride channel family protein